MTLLPLYLPLHTGDEKSDALPIFIGGVNFYLAEKIPFYDKLPSWFHRLLDSSNWLKKISNLMGMTKAAELGKMTLSMLKFNRSFSKNEVLRLQEWLKATQVEVDLIILSNALLLGIAPELKKILNKPVVCTLQGEDTFLDSLPDPYSQQCWQVLKEKSASIDQYIAVSQTHANIMFDKGGLEKDKIKVIHNGVEHVENKNSKLTRKGNTIGYLARVSYDKGMPFLVDSFIKLREDEKYSELKLKIAGVKLPQDDRTVEEAKAKLSQKGLLEDVEWQFNISAEEKEAFYASIDLLSVPAHYGESFGLYIIEAWSWGIPVVQPKSGAFPELIEKGGGGLLFEEQSINSAVESFKKVLDDELFYKELCEKADHSFEKYFSLQAMAEKVILTLNQIMEQSCQKMNSSSN